MVLSVGGRDMIKSRFFIGHISLGCEVHRVLSFLFSFHSLYETRGYIGLYLYNFPSPVWNKALIDLSPSEEASAIDNTQGIFQKCFQNGYLSSHSLPGQKYENFFHGFTL